MDRFLAHPFVYTRIRPLLYFGLDYSGTFAWLEENPEDVLVDIGCGAGDSLRYVKLFQNYYGFDINPVMLNLFQKLHKDPRVHVYPRKLSADELKKIKPTKAIAIGLFHHLNNLEATGVLELLSNQNTISKLVTLDTVFVKEKHFNNLISSWDRGRFVRYADEYKNLFEKGCWTIAKEDLSTSRTGNPLMYLYSTCLVRK